MGDDENPGNFSDSGKGSSTREYLVRFQGYPTCCDEWKSAKDVPGEMFDEHERTYEDFVYSYDSEEEEEEEDFTVKM